MRPCPFQTARAEPVQIVDTRFLRSPENARSLQARVFGAAHFEYSRESSPPPPPQHLRRQGRLAAVLSALGLPTPAAAAPAPAASAAVGGDERELVGSSSQVRATGPTKRGGWLMVDGRRTALSLSLSLSLSLQRSAVDGWLTAVQQPRRAVDRRPVNGLRPGACDE